ncbi:sensor histidine kinase [Gracilibacillus kekensis]|uniref:histidine kinase n=1 Tax=Gracilibacillus kekensis TaxID=1027249 RepID=A0A1M7PXH4_9BACI|nr:sensor histidine kinase [Gracilibacillus kekensis]SHN22398.1 two-component system, sensor histidine kinase YesM [Gracilibacillus kekensis]
MRQLILKLNQLTLRSRLIIAVIVCILLPWISTYFVSNYFTKDVLEERATRQAYESLSMIEVNLRSILDDVMYASNYIQFDTKFNQIMKQHQAIDPEAPQASQKIALNYIELSNQISSITDLLAPTYFTILFSNDLFYMNYSLSEFNPLELYQEPWFSELQNSNYYDTLWIGAHPNYISSDKESDPYLISVGKNLQQATQYDAFLIVSVQEKQIRSLLDNFQQDSNSEYFLTNQKGIIYSSVDESLISQNMPYDVHNNDYQIVEKKGKEYFLVSHPVSYSNWRLVSLVPYQETIGNINGITRTTILIQGALLVLFLIGLIVLVRELTKPLSELNAVTKSVEQGNLQRRAKTYGNNDIAKLGHSFNHMLDTLEEMILEIKEQEEDKRTAELEMLQAQINPHFLFNVLNAIRLQIKMNGDKESAQLIHALSSLLRMTINRNNAFIPLIEEVEIIENYMQLMNFRHQHEIELIINLKKGTKNVEVPRFFLQPLIENAVIYGYNNSQGTIVISSRIIEEGKMELQVSDDGEGIDDQVLQQLKNNIYNEKQKSTSQDSQSFNGIGIHNVYQRMKLIYGDTFDMEIYSSKGMGTNYRFYFPI